MKPLLLLLTFTITTLHCQPEKILWTVAWSPDGQRIALGGGQGDLKLFDGRNFQLLKTYPMEGVIISRFRADSKGVAGLDWHPSKEILITINKDCRL